MSQRVIFSRWRQTLQLGGLFLLLSFLLIFASSHNGLVDGTMLTITAAILSGIALFFTIRKRESGSAIEFPLWIFLVIITVSAVLSIDPRRSLFEVWMVGIILLLVLASSELVRRGWSRHIWITALLMVGAVMMVIAWFEVFDWHLQSFRATGSLFSPIHFRLSVPNFMGVFLNVLLFPALARMMIAESKGQRLAHAAWSLSAVLLVYLTSSRGAWLGLIAGAGLLVFLNLIRVFGDLRGAITRLFRTRLRIVISLVILIVCAALLVLLFLRQSQHPTHATSIMQSRSEFWGPAWSAFLDRPLLGQGPYTFISAYLQSNSVPPRSLFVYAHSIYMDLLSGSGLLGLLGFAWLAYSVIRTLWRGAFKSAQQDFAVLAGALGSTAAFLVHGIFDSVHHTIPTAGWTFALVIGIALGVCSDARRTSFDLPRWLSLTVALVAWLNLWLLSPIERSVDQAGAGEWSKAETTLQSALARDPHLAVTYSQAGMIQAQLASQGEITAQHRSVTSWYQATVTDPAWALNHANYGIVLRADRQLDLSAAALSQAVELSPASAVYWLNYAVTLEQLGNRMEADRAYRSALDLHPDWYPAYFWRETPFRQQVAADWDADRSAPELQPLLVLEEEATTVPSLAVNHLALANAYLDLSRWSDASRSLSLARLAYVSSPAQGVEIDWLSAVLAAGQGFFEQAVNLGERALANQVTQGLFGPGSFGSLYYAELMYRRPALPQDLVPQAATIVMPDAWGDRVLLLSRWHRTHGNQDRADELLRQLAWWIPDYPYVLQQGVP